MYHSGLSEFDSICELQPEFRPWVKIDWVICMKSPWCFALTVTRAPEFIEKTTGAEKETQCASEQRRF